MTDASSDSDTGKISLDASIPKDGVFGIMQCANLLGFLQYKVSYESLINMPSFFRRDLSLKNPERQYRSSRNGSGLEKIADHLHGTLRSIGQDMLGIVNLEELERLNPNAVIEIKNTEALIKEYALAISGALGRSETRAKAEGFEYLPKERSEAIKASVARQYQKRFEQQFRTLDSALETVTTIPLHWKEETSCVENSKKHIARAGSKNRKEYSADATLLGQLLMLGWSAPHQFDLAYMHPLFAQRAEHFIGKTKDTAFFMHQFCSEPEVRDIARQVIEDTCKRRQERLLKYIQENAGEVQSLYATTLIKASRLSEIKDYLTNQAVTIGTLLDMAGVPRLPSGIESGNDKKVLLSLARPLIKLDDDVETFKPTSREIKEIRALAQKEKCPETRDAFNLLLSALGYSTITPAAARVEDRSKVPNSRWRDHLDAARVEHPVKGIRAVRRERNVVREESSTPKTDAPPFCGR